MGSRSWVLGYISLVPSSALGRKKRQDLRHSISRVPSLETLQRLRSEIPVNTTTTVRPALSGFALHIQSRVPHLGTPGDHNSVYSTP